MLISGETRADLTFHHTPRVFNDFGEVVGAGSVCHGVPMRWRDPLRGRGCRRSGAPQVTLVAEVATVAKLI